MPRKTAVMCITSMDDRGILVQEIAIIDAVGMLVEKHKNIRRGAGFA